MSVPDILKYDMVKSYAQDNVCQLTESETIALLKKIDGGVFYVMCIMMSYILEHLLNLKILLSPFQLV